MRPLLNKQPKELFATAPSSSTRLLLVSLAVVVSLQSSSKLHISYCSFRLSVLISLDVVARLRKAGRTATVKDDPLLFFLFPPVSDGKQQLWLQHCLLLIDKARAAVDSLGRNTNSGSAFNVFNSEEGGGHDFFTHFRLVRPPLVKVAI